MDRKNHKKVFTIDTRIFNFIYRRERREMNTNTILIHYYYYSYEREKQQRCFPQRSIKVALVCSLKPALDTYRQSADLYRRTP